MYHKNKEAVVVMFFLWLVIPSLCITFPDVEFKESSDSFNGAEGG
jgi:hypothetical protein